MAPSPSSSHPPPHLQSQVESLHGIGTVRARQLRALGVATVADLLEYFPRNYQYESAERPISQIKSGPLQLARGTVAAVDYIAARPRPRFEATLEDGVQRLALVFFNGAYLRGKIHPGQVLRVQGTVRFFRGIPQMANPKWEVIDASTAAIEEAKFRPVYPATARLPSETIGRIIDENLDAAVAQLPEWFDPDLPARRQLVGRTDAYRMIHRPASPEEAGNARRRIVYDELMLMQLGLGIGKRLRQGRLSAPLFRIDRLLDQRIRARFPFQMTDAQQKTVYEILRDLGSGRPMNRLLQGDVGSGKTIVALYAMLAGVANKLQSALLAPTEVLAEQHFLTISNLLRDSGVKIELFTSRTRRGDHGELARKLAEGEVHIAIGTQALIQKGIEFANLGLVVVDEQHKLGVMQRAVLRGKGYSPHYLVMTATPIPRTLALSYFADFDVSVIDRLPPGRQPIKTQWYRADQAGLAYDFIRQQVRAGRQAYIVLPQIDDDRAGAGKSVKREFDRLSKGPLNGLTLAMLHGQMETGPKQAVMAAFRNGATNVLVATTVIEVGIDVPNATVMLIDNADRFGLSQLHQLRGRVGRGSEASWCLLISDPPTESAEQRLQAMMRTSNGFEIAEMDLQLRGPGEFFGIRQHGLPEFKMADITREIAMLHQAREDALKLLDGDPELKSPAHAHLRQTLLRQFGDGLGLAQVG